jgi:WD40 repeat protein
MTFCSNTPKIEQLKHHTKQNICVRWSSNGQYIATASADKTVNLYKTK